MGFWDRRLEEFKAPGPGRAGPQPGQQGPLGYIPQPSPQAQPGQDMPAYVRQQLAVRQAGPREVDLARHIQHEGYITKPPEWVQRQPHDTCPNCGGVDLAAVSNGGYSRPGMPGTILRCFDCNWSSGRGISALWGVPSSGPVVGAAIQSRDGHVSLQNFGAITA